MLIYSFSSYIILIMDSLLEIQVLEHNGIKFVVCGTTLFNVFISKLKIFVNGILPYSMEWIHADMFENQIWRILLSIIEDGHISKDKMAQAS